MRILVVEDYKPIKKAIVKALREETYLVDETEDGETALALAQSEPYDLIILDLMLPRKSGLEVLKEIRKYSSVHILILTAMDSIDSRIVGLDAGADDYLVKPFELSELLARIRALIRRKYGKKSSIIKIHDLEVDTISKSCYRGKEKIELTAKEFGLLELLAVRAGQVVSRSMIWDTIYDVNSSAESNVVDVFIATLRKKINKPGTSKLIHTRRGFGYVLGEFASEGDER